jgi:hypothetical protein
LAHPDEGIATDGYQRAAGHDAHFMS